MMSTSSDVCPMQPQTQIDINDENFCNLWSTRHFYRVAVELNNISTMFLEIDYHDLARETLKDSIAAMKLCLRNDDEDSFVNLRSSVDRDPSIIRARKRSAELCALHKKSRSSTSSDSNSVVVAYRKPIKLNLPENDTVYPLRRRFSFQCVEETAVILFNMALSYHNTMEQKAIRRALEMYEMANQTLMTGAGKLWESPCFENISCAMFLMALLNNMGQANYALGQYSVARIKFDDLLTIKSLASCEEVHEVNEFVLNSMLVDIRPVAAPSA